MLMAADILLYDADIVPVGKDQLQHLEITRDVASRFNHQMGETFVIPKAKIQENSHHIPGTDGQKMSKSKNNTINVFLPEKDLRKQIMGIQTDSTPLEDPKDPEKCNVFALYALLAPASSVNELRGRYLSGGMGYGHAKQQLFEYILAHFSKERQLYDYFHQHPEEVYIALAKGAEKARIVANEVLLRVRDKVGY
jgi:tryptophanyl-tRNA synthetase